MLKYYINFDENGKITNFSNCPKIDSVEIKKEDYDLILQNSNKYLFKDGELIKNNNFEDDQIKKEKEKISKLCLTAADVERALYKGFGKDFEDIVSMVEALNASGGADIDIKALKIELKANNFYRGNPYVDAIGRILGITSVQLDEFFKTNDYRCLMNK